MGDSSHPKRLGYQRALSLLQPAALDPPAPAPHLHLTMVRRAQLITTIEREERNRRKNNVTSSPRERARVILIPLST